MARMGERRGAYRILVGRLEGQKHLEDPGVSRRITLKYIFKKWHGEALTGLIWLQGRDRWLALVNAVIKLRVPLSAGDFLTT